jgi:hypothetical protein
MTGRDLEHLQQLQIFFHSLVDDMSANVQQLALRGFNAWLVRHSRRLHCLLLGLMLLGESAQRFWMLLLLWRQFVGLLQPPSVSALYQSCRSRMSHVGH